MKQKTLNTTVSENESKHTPGEWKVIKSLTNEFYPFEILNTSEFTTIAKVSNLNRNGSSEANARLIAAAPELFQMVKDLKNCIKRLTQDNLSQFERDTEAQWEGESHELLTRIAPNYYRNANE